MLLIHSRALVGPQGVARQRKAIVDGLRDSVVGFQSGVSDVSSRDVRAPSPCFTCLAVQHLLKPL